MDLGLRDMRAVVTGGSRGIGLATARTLALEGARVMLVARAANRLDTAAADIRAQCREAKVLTMPCDTSDNASVTAMAAAAEREWGGIDVLVNAAARPGANGPVPGVLDEWEHGIRAEFETKVLGYLRCIRATVPLMPADGWARIVNVGGNAALQTGNFVGTIRNVAVAALTKNVADELAPRGIHVAGVHPGLTVTERTAELAAKQGLTLEEAQVSLASRVSIGRLITAEEVAVAITFLASPMSVSINGDCIAVGGGIRGVIRY